jgi:NADP-dependent 3-hydroxy acid dehydrogenase YdfG
MQELKGRRALVTGASAGIGAATARRLAGEGARVVLAARRMDRLRELASELDGAEALELDVRDAEAVGAALAGRELDLVVANAGLARGTDPIQTVRPESWDDMIDTNVKGVLAVIRAVLPGMIERGRGDLVLLGSVAGRQVYPGGNVYCATKHAVRALYEALRIDAAGAGVRFTTVDPGMVETEFSEVRFGGDRERASAVYRGFAPLQPEDVADAIAYVVTRPAHVNVGELVLWPTDQASTTIVSREG